MWGVRGDGVKDWLEVFLYVHWDPKREGLGRRHWRSEWPWWMLVLCEMVSIPQENTKAECRVPSPREAGRWCQASCSSRCISLSHFLTEPGGMGKGELEDILFWLFYFPMKQEAGLSAQSGDAGGCPRSDAGKASESWGPQCLQRYRFPPS